LKKLFGFNHKMELLSFTMGVLLQWILEVAGAGGAIWGMSEVWKMRGAKTFDGQITNDRLRIVANIVFALGMIRMVFRYAPNWGIKQALVDPHAWIVDFGRSTRMNTPDAMAGTCAFELFFFIVGFFMAWVLEVLGAGGAWWGMSEVWGLRGYGRDECCQDGQETNDQIRWVSNIVFAIALVRLGQKFLPDYPANVAMHSPHAYALAEGSSSSFQVEVVTFVVGVFMQFVLEVLGAGGAWWGMSEVWGWRGYGRDDCCNDGADTNDQIRYISNIVFAIACVRMCEKYLPMNDHHLAMLAPHDWVMEYLTCGGSRSDDLDTERQNQEVGM